MSRLTYERCREPGHALSSTIRAPGQAAFCHHGRGRLAGRPGFCLRIFLPMCVGPSSSGNSTSIATAPRVNTRRSSLRYTSSVTRVLAWPTRWAISSIGIPELDSSDTKLCRSSLRVQAIGFIPAAATTRRKALRTLAGSSGEPVVVENTRSNSSSWHPLSALCFSTRSRCFVRASTQRAGNSSVRRDLLVFVSPCARTDLQRWMVGGAVEIDARPGQRSQFLGSGTNEQRNDHVSISWWAIA